MRNIIKAYWVGIAGLSFFWPMFRAPYIGGLFSVMRQGSDIALQARFLFDMVLLLGGMIAASVATTSPSADRSLRKRSGSLAIASCCCMVVGNILLVAAESMPMDRLLTMMLGSSLSALGLIVTILLWGLSWLDCNKKDALLCLALSFLLSFSFGAFDYLPRPLNLLPLMVLPLGSNVFLFASGRSSALRGSNALPAPSGRPSWKGPSSVATAIALVVGLCSCILVRSSWGMGSYAYHVQGSFVFTYLLSAAVAFAMVLLIAKSKDLETSFFFILIALAACLLLGILANAALGPSISVFFTGTANTCMQFAFIAYCITREREGSSSVLLSLGAFLGLVASTSVVSTFALPILFGIDSSTSPGFALPLAFMSSVVLIIGIIAFCIVFFKEVTHRMAVPESDSAITVFSRAVDSIAIDYGLSAREKEVLELIAQGHSVRRISELLFLAPSTVQGYMKILYRKMGVHSRQSVIDLVHQRTGELSAGRQPGTT